MAGVSSRFKLSAQPRDVVAPVTIASAANEPSWRLSKAPSDRLAPVQVAQASDGQPQWRLSQAPSDRLAPVQVAQSLDAGEATTLNAKEPDYSDDVISWEDPAQDGIAAAAPVSLDIPALLAIVREVAVPHSGSDTYAAISSLQPEHGLSFGLLLFTQASGRLGSVLRLMRQRDESAFAQAFGPHGEQLLAVTTSASKESRLQRVGGEALTDSGWVARFRAAGTLPVCQAAQNEEAIAGLFRPVMSLALALGLDTGRGVAMALDRAVVSGLAGGMGWITRVAGPLQSTRQRGFALQTLGFPSVAAFQGSAGLTPNGSFTPETHARMVEALRRQGLIPVPTAAELIARMVAAAAGPGRERLLRLQASTVFSDTKVG